MSRKTLVPFQLPEAIVGGTAAQYADGVTITESTHATSRRASLTVGTNWQVGSDILGAGTREFSFYTNTGGGRIPLKLSADGLSVILSGNPVNALDAAPKQYVDLQNEVIVAAADPIATNAQAELWIDTVTNPPAAPLASGITFSPTGTIAATNVQSAIAEVASEANSSNIPWINLGSLLVNGWINYAAPFGPAYYRKVDDMVQVRGLVQSGSPSTAPVCTFPVGYRPLYQPIICTPCNVGLAEIRIDTGGVMSVSSVVPVGVGTPSTWLSLHLTFSTIT